MCQALDYVVSHVLLKLLRGRYQYLIFTGGGKRPWDVNELAQDHTATNERTHADPQVGLTAKLMLSLFIFKPFMGLKEIAGSHPLSF